ncbi:hypothetical protein COV94_05510, partial [Candidatus Woesearchaeota archaeon CG11_big_fil_rev_8_21_14_0_20_57_5]
MKRKIIRQGHNTLTITLPSAWVKKCDLHSGDEVEISETNKALVVSAQSNVSGSKVTLDVSGFSIPLIWKHVLSAYRAGYDEIIVRYNPRDSKRNFYTAFSYDTLAYINEKEELSTPELIQALVNRLVGVEIIDQKEAYCVIRELGETTYKEFNNALRRIFLIIKSMSEELIEAIDGSKTLLKRIHMEDTNLDRFEDFCIRVLNKRGYEDFRKTPTMHSIIFLLEMVGDEFKGLAAVLNQKTKVSAPMHKALEDISRMF